METSLKLIPVIISGGVGSRLWPLSREQHPKPFIRLADGKSILQHTWLRAAALANVTEIVTVTNRELFFKTQDDYAEIIDESTRVINNSYILEPFGRNTAAAIASAAIHIAEIHGNDAILMVMPADHMMSNQTAFAESVAKATQLAQQGKLVTFGITPNRSETAYGYIQTKGSEVLQFVEKPDLETATKYIETGQYLWNSGLFCFSAGTIIKEMARYASEVLSTTQSCLQQSKIASGDGFSQIQLDSKLFKNVPDISIDYAVMEKSNNLAVVACNFTWSDIGSWNEFADLYQPDDSGNRINGDALLHNVDNCYIQTTDRAVGLVGVENLVVVDTADALLVANKDNVQDVKHIYTQLKEQNHETYKHHLTEKRPWGTYTILDVAEGFKIKRIEVNPHSSLSLQMHHHRCEHWVIVSGVAKVTNEQDNFIVHSNESTYIKAGHKHRLENPGNEPLIIIEVQTGDYLGEDDIIRFEQDD